MNRYEITIHNMTDDMEMNAVQDALYTHNIKDAGDIEVGAYLCDNKPRSVFVDPSEVVQAVKVLNELGYETDEDEVTE